MPPVRSSGQELAATTAHAAPEDVAPEDAVTDIAADPAASPDGVEAAVTDESVPESVPEVPEVPVVDSAPRFRRVRNICFVFTGFGIITMVASWFAVQDHSKDLKLAAVFGI